MSELTHCITQEGGDVSFSCRPDDTILRSALRAGIAFPYECNVGACGNCKFQLVDGELRQRSARSARLERQGPRTRPFSGLPVGAWLRLHDQGQAFGDPTRPCIGRAA